MWSARTGEREHKGLEEGRVLRLQVTGDTAVAFPQSVLEEIRNVALDRFLAIPRGGLEIGGVLFGSRSRGEIAISAYKPLEIEYLTGPSFILSPADEVKLRELLASSKAEASLAGTEPVGWYHSHTRSDVSLSDEDTELHRRVFPGPGHLALVVKPHKLETTEAALYVAGSQEFAVARFVIEPWSADASPAAEPESEPGPVSHQANAAPHADLVPPDAPRVSPPTRRKTARVAAAILGVVLAVAAVLVGASTYLPTQSIHKPIELRVAGPGSNLTISWNAGSINPREVRTAELLIVDGGYAATMVPLADEELPRGSVNYVRSSGNVEVRLRLHRHDGRLQQQVSRFLAADELSRRDTPAPPSVGVQEVRAANTAPEPVRETQPRVLESERARRQAAVPPQTATKAPEPVLMAADVRVPSLPRLENPVSLPPAEGRLPAAPRAQPTPPPARRSGRAIWTGRLEPGGILLIDDGRASMGALNGRMPEQPSDAQVSPADLVEAGIVVYGTSDRVEAPSSANGWNLTTYRADPKRLRDIAIIESPGAANGYRLMIRGNNRPISMIVIDWQE